MKELDNLELLEITFLKPKEFLLRMNVNGEKRNFTAWIEMTEPFFGVNFSDDFIYISRNYRSDVQQLIKIIENYHHGEEIHLPIPLLIEEKAPELQAG